MCGLKYKTKNSLRRKHAKFYEIMKSIKKANNINVVYVEKISNGNLILPDILMNIVPSEKQS